MGRSCRSSPSPRDRSRRSGLGASARRWGPWCGRPGSGWMPYGRVLRVGLPQWSPSLDPDANVAAAVAVVDRLAAEAPGLVLLPENCLAIGTNEQMRAGAVREDSVGIG